MSSESELLSFESFESLFFNVNEHHKTHNRIKRNKKIKFNYKFSNQMDKTIIRENLFTFNSRTNRISPNQMTFQVVCWFPLSSSSYFCFYLSSVISLYIYF